MRTKLIDGISCAAFLLAFVFAGGMDSEGEGFLICTVGLLASAALLFIFGHDRQPE